MTSTLEKTSLESFDRALSCGRSHADALAARIAVNLNAHNYQAAFRDADRLCRIAPRPESRLWTLRAQALLGMGRTNLAHNDLASAFAIDPTDLTLSRIILSGPFRGLQVEAAQSVISSTRADRATIELALDVLLKRPMSVAGNLRVDRGTIKGWLAWCGGHRLTAFVSCAESATLKVDIAGEADHRFASAGRYACDIDLKTPTSLSLSLTWRIGDSPATHADVFLRESVLPDHAIVDLRSGIIGEGSKDISLGCTIVVPIFNDIDATAACLDSLRHQGNGSDNPEVILVNDNPANKKMGEMISGVADREGYTLLHNPKNLGFVHSVNRALAICNVQKDVLLLNSDVILPDGCIPRLLEVAYSSEDIGTVTPLSNNGELTSFPKPFCSNPMRTREEINSLNDIAARVNRGRVITLPNGIGFCLLIKRACLNVIGSLSTSFLRGYYEDVEFCLRAREKGFRNVCATNIYVGHEGSRSFKGEKTRLVARNLRNLQRRFPEFLKDSLAFVKADPLASAREALAVHASRPSGQTRLLIADNFEDATLERRISALSQLGTTIFILIPDRHNQCGETVTIRGTFDSASMRFSVTGDHDSKELIVFLHQHGVQEIEVIDDSRLSNRLLATLDASNFAVSHLADRAPFASFVRQTSHPCPQTEGKSPCSACKNAFAEQIGQARDKRAFRGTNSKDEGRMLAQNRMAAAFLEAGNLVDETIPRRRAPSRRRGQVTTLGILYPRRAATLERFLRLLSRELPEQSSSNVVVLGQTHDDGALISHPLVSVTGAAHRNDYDQLLRSYQVTALFSPDRWASVALIDELSTRHNIPKAYFDWSFRGMETFAGDLVLDPRICDAKAIAALLGWLTPGGNAD
jgi:O-antigen biosynthesis protein